MSNHLPKFAKVLKKRALQQKGAYLDDSSTQNSENFPNEWRNQQDFETDSTYISEEPRQKYQNFTEYDDDSISEMTVKTSEGNTNEDIIMLRDTLLNLEKQNAKLKRENRQILDLKQQLDVEKEVNDNLSSQLHETQNELQREKQLNSSLNEQLSQLEQILTGKQQITEAKSTMVMRIQEEYNTVINDYQKIQDLYNSMVVQLREARNKISELEAELENAKKDYEQPKKYNPPPFNFEDDLKPKNTFGMRDDFDFNVDPQIPSAPAVSAYKPPDNDDFFKETAFNDYPPAPLNQTAKQPFKEPLKPPVETSAVHKAALVDNIHFGEPPEQESKLGLDLIGLNREELEELLNELIAEKHETERLLALAPKQGISKSRAMREKEELADRADLLEKKISKVKREMKK